MTDLSNKLTNQLHKKLIPTVDIRQGGIYRVADDPENPIVKFPEDNLPPDHPKHKRTFHHQRYVLVIQNNELNQNPDFTHVQVIPLSSQFRETTLSAEIPEQFLAQELPGPSYALVYLSQPILKIFLTSEVGYVDPSHEVFTKIRAIYLRLVGLL